MPFLYTKRQTKRKDRFAYMKFDYYYGSEADQFSFYRIPKMLVKDSKFKSLSNDAKILYGLMLDRMSLSMKNGWLDEENRAYIIYTVDAIMEDLGCAKEKCTKVLAELDSKKGFGLIEKKRQGLGKPDIIYVKNFSTLEVGEESEIQLENLSKSDVSTEVRKSNFKRFDNRTSRSSEIEFQEVRKSKPNYTNINYTNNSYNYINHINKSNREDEVRERMMDTIDANSYIDIIKKNIWYDCYMSCDDEWHDKELYQELFEIICEIVCIKHSTVRIGGDDYPYELVKSRFLKLTSFHLEYVIDCMRKTTTKITNIKAYMITALYNAPSTINHYYQQEVQHDMYEDDGG